MKFKDVFEIMHTTSVEKLSKEKIDVFIFVSLGF